MDDMPYNILALSRFLKRFRGLEIDSALHGLESVEKVKQALAESRPFEVIFMDLNMPIMGGFEATARIRALQPGVKIIIASAQSEADYKEESRQSGADYFLEKPISSSNFAEAVRELQLENLFISSMEVASTLTMKNSHR